MGSKLKTIIAVVVIAVAAILGGLGVAINVGTDEHTNTPKIEIKYAEQSVPAEVEIEGVDIDEAAVPTVESVDAEKVVETECDGEQECAKGAYLPSIDISNPSTFYNSVINQCIDFDGAYGSQCFDLMAYFHKVYTGRWLSANGTGAAYGIWDARGYNNQGDEYELIYNAQDIKPGDFVVFHNGVYGHVGMALGGYNNGYVTLLGTNQGGFACPGGGASANVINISLATFSGAFRPRSWIVPEPAPAPEPEQNNVVNYTYVKGDYFSGVIQRLGLQTANGLWGANGDVAYYNKQLENQGLVVYKYGKYWGNIPIGTTITLERR